MNVPSPQSYSPKTYRCSSRPGFYICRPYSSIYCLPQQWRSAFSPLSDYSLVLEHAEQESGAVPPTIEHMLTVLPLYLADKLPTHVWFIDFDTFYASLQVTRLSLLLPQPKSTRIVGVTFYSVVRQSLTCRSIFAHL